MPDVTHEYSQKTLEAVEDAMLKANVKPVTTSNDEAAELLPLLCDSDKDFLSDLREWLRPVPDEIARLNDQKKWLNNLTPANDDDVAAVLSTWDDIRNKIPGYERLADELRDHKFVVAVRWPL